MIIVIVLLSLTSSFLPYVHATSAVVTSIHLGAFGYPAAMAVNQNINMIYVLANGSPPRIFVINGATNAVVQSIPLTILGGGLVEDIAVNQKTNMIYALDYLGSNSEVIVINGTKNAVVGNIFPIFSGGPESVTVNEKTNMIYVFGTPPRLWVANGTTNAIVYNAIIPSTNLPGGIMADSNTNKIYALEYGSENEVYVINGETSAVGGTIFPIFSGYPAGVTVNQNTNMIYVFGTPPRLWVANGTTNAIVYNAIIPSSGTPEGVAINPNTNVIYGLEQFGGGSGIYAINGVTNSIMSTISPIFPNIECSATAPRQHTQQCIAVNPKTNMIYVLAQDGGGIQVLVINGISNHIPPYTPTDLAATALSSTSIKLSWTASFGATNYHVFRSTSSTGPFTTLAGTSTVPSFTNTGLAPNTAYYYKINALNAVGASALSSSTNALTEPPVPTGVAAHTINSTAISVKWTAPTGATSYKVFRSISSSNPFTTLAGSQTSSPFNNTGLNPGTKYYYEITAVNEGGSSFNSTIVSATTLPSAPTDLAATALSSTSIKLSWTASFGATNYHVFRSTSSTGPFTTLAGTSTVPSFTNTGLAPNTAYYYEISALDAGGTSALSNPPESTTTLPPPTKITLVSSQNPSVIGHTITFTATVSPITPSTHVPTGNVTFIIDGIPQSPVMLAGSKAALIYNTPIIGSHQIIANYSGDVNFTTSTSSSLVQKMNDLSTLIKFCMVQVVGKSTCWNPSNGAANSPITFISGIPMNFSLQFTDPSKTFNVQVIAGKVGIANATLGNDNQFHAQLIPNSSWNGVISYNYQQEPYSLDTLTLPPPQSKQTLEKLLGVDLSQAITSINNSTNDTLSFNISRLPNNTSLNSTANFNIVTNSTYVPSLNDIQVAQSSGAPVLNFSSDITNVTSDGSQQQIRISYFVPYGAIKPALLTHASSFHALDTNNRISEWCDANPQTCGITQNVFATVEHTGGDAFGFLFSSLDLNDYKRMIDQEQFLKGKCGSQDAFCKNGFDLVIDKTKKTQAAVGINLFITMNMFASGVGTIPSLVWGTGTGLYLTSEQKSIKSLAASMCDLNSFDCGDEFKGDSNNARDGKATVTPERTSMHLFADTLGSIPFGQPVKITAQVVPAESDLDLPGGDVTFTVDGKNPIEEGLIGYNSIFDLPVSTAVGTHTITAQYSGDVNFAKSTNTLSITIDPSLTGTWKGFDVVIFHISNELGKATCTVTAPVTLSLTQTGTDVTGSGTITAANGVSTNPTFETCFSTAATFPVSGTVTGPGSASGIWDNGVTFSGNTMTSTAPLQCGSDCTASDSFKVTRTSASLSMTADQHLDQTLNSTAGMTIVGDHGIFSIRITNATAIP